MSLARARTLHALLMALALEAPASLTAQDTKTAEPTPAYARVTYISGQSAYIDAGSRDGLREGARLEVMRAGASVGELFVEFISSTRASCRIAAGRDQLTIGDSARFFPVKVESRAADSVSSSSSRAVGRAGATTLRGRIGIRYLSFDPGVGGALTQPAFDVRLDGQHLGDTPLGVQVDVRAQRSMTSSPTLSAAGASVTKVYQAAVVLNPSGSPLRLSLGRQFATALSTVGLFDGASLDLDYRRVSIGAFGGNEPDLMTFGLSSAAREYGAYVQIHNVPGSSPLWALSLGGVGAYSQGQIDREFGIAQATFNSRHFSVYAAQEVDVNRGWKASVENSATTPTSTFVTIMVSPADAFNLSGGYDNRRNVRLYRDYVNPEVAFDDTFRQGDWAGASLFLIGHVRMSGDVRLSSGGTAGNSQSNTGAFSLVRLTPLQIGLHARTTVFTGTIASGRLQSVAIELNPFGTIRIEGSAGTRDSSLPLDALPATHISWTGVDADIGIGRSVYLMLSTYRENGTNDHSVQSFVSVSYRF